MTTKEATRKGKAKPADNVLSFDDIKSAQDIETVPVPVPEWGGSVLVRTLTAEDSIRFAEELEKDQKEGGLLIVRNSVVDEDGKKVFHRKDQYDVLRGKSMRAVRRIVDFIVDFNGLSPESKKLAALLRKYADDESDGNVKARLLSIAEDIEGGDEGEG